MSVSLFMPFCNTFNTDNLANTLEALGRQTLHPDELLLLDDSLPERQEEVKSLVASCSPWTKARHLSFPFRTAVPQWSNKYNTAFRERSPHDMILILCSNWILEETWLEKMVKGLEELGPHCMVAGDSPRKDMQEASGQQFDWFEGFPDLFMIPNPWHEPAPPSFERDETKLSPRARDHVLAMTWVWDYIDEGFNNIMWADDWLPWDEEFDTIGAWHALCEWGFRLFRNGLRLWIRRDMQAYHQGRHPMPDWLAQTNASTQMYHRKMHEQGILDQPIHIVLRRRTK